MRSSVTSPEDFNSDPSYGNAYWMSSEDLFQILIKKQ